MKEKDEVAYVRFASVYRQFKSLDDFVTELKELLVVRDDPRARQVLEELSKNGAAFLILKTLRKKLMRAALAEARRGRGRTSPNPMVGAVVAKGDRIIAKGFHAFAGGPHAEVNALVRAGLQARGADLYVTLEPCNHQGRTPPCTEAILKAGIARVFIAQMDPNPRVKGGGAEYLRHSGLEVNSGILEKEATELNRFFTRHIVTGKPYVILKSAATLDGKLATRTGHSKWITGDKARAYVHRLRDQVDAILVGRGTVGKGRSFPDHTLGQWKDRAPSATDRSGYKPDATRDGQGLSGHQDQARTLVAAGLDADEQAVGRLEALGMSVWRLPLCRGRVSLTALVERLGRENIISLLIEGGSEVNSRALLEDRIVDKILFFYAPKIVGGRTAPGLVGGAGVGIMAESLAMDIVGIRRFGLDFLVEAIPKYDPVRLDIMNGEPAD